MSQKKKTGAATSTSITDGSLRGTLFKAQVIIPIVFIAAAAYCVVYDVRPNTSALMLLNVPTSRRNMPTRTPSSSAPRPLLPSELVRQLPDRDPHAQESVRKEPKNDGTPRQDDFPPATNFDFPDVSHWPTPNFTTTVLSTAPRVFAFDNFITHDEAKLLIDVADGRTQPAQTVGRGGSGDHVSDSIRLDYYRNNEQYLARQQEEIHSPVMNHVLRRVSRAVRAPSAHAEGLQFGRYAVNEFFKMHNDAVPVHAPRLTTFLAYLQAPIRGGETLFAFTSAAINRCLEVQDDCCENPPPGTYLMKPEVGKGVLFYGYNESAVFTGAWHMACSVKEGVKWVIQRWVRFEDYQRVVYPFDQRVDGPRGDEPPNGRTWDVRTISAQFPRIYYIEQMFTTAALNTMFAQRKMSLQEQRKCDITARSFHKSTVEYLDLPHGQKMRIVPNNGMAVILVFDKARGRVIFPTDDAMAQECTRTESGCCLPPDMGSQVDVEVGDALLFYPRHTDDQDEKWGRKYALCGEGMRIVRVTYIDFIDVV